MTDKPKNKLPLIQTTRKSGNERFLLNGKSLDFTLLDFWQWSVSDLVSNATRGILAEFIVAKALDLAHGARTEWDPFDLELDGIKVEVKSGAYIQSWAQDEYSKITFGIAPTHGWDAKTDQRDSEPKRQADAYVFCVLKHKDKSTINPLDLDQWEFYILPTKVLDEKRPTQKTITMGSLLRLGPVKVGYGGIREAILVLLKR